MNRVIVITGGASGIGKATAEKFLKEGDKVVIADFAGPKADETMAEFAKLGDAAFCPCNITNEEECEKLANLAVEKFGRIDVLVNVAGITGKRAPFFETGVAEVKKTMDVNLFGSLNTTYYCGKKMAENKSGVVIYIGSIDGFMANTEPVGYHASKGAVRMTTMAMAKELAPYGIRVCSVAPGWVNTSLMDQKVADFGGTLHLRGRILQPEELANVIYLVSLPEAAAINGTTVMADDGYTTFKGFKAKGLID